MSKPRYRYAHQQERKRWLPVIAAGDGYCWRCGCWLPPDGLWDLGHDDYDVTIYRGPECRPCNRGTAATRGNRARGKPRSWNL